MLGPGDIGVNVHAHIRAVAGRAVYGVRSVDEPRALLEHTVRGVSVRIEAELRRRHQAAFDLVGGQSRINLEHQRHDAACHGRRLTCAGHCEVVTIIGDVLLVRFRQLAPVTDEAADVAPGRQHFRLHEAFVGRASRRERCEHIVSRIVGCVGVSHGAHRDDVRVIARHPDRHWLGTGIAGRYHDDDSGAPGLHDGLVDGVFPIMGTHGGAE